MQNQSTPDDWREETKARIERCKVYQVLLEKCKTDPSGTKVMALIDDATHYAYHRTKTIIRHMGEYTLHDGDHLFRVLHLMERLIPEEKLKELLVPELMLMVLSAFFHDIGMAPSESEVLSWKRFWDRTPAPNDPQEQRNLDAFRIFASTNPQIVLKERELTSSAISQRQRT